MTIENYIAYFETAATNHKLILHNSPNKHFCKVRVQEVLTSLRKDIHFPAVVAELPEIYTEDRLSDNYRDILLGAVLILKPVPPTDYDAEIQVINTCVEIAKDFRTKIMNDRRKGNLKGLDANRFKIVEVGPVFNNLYGARLEFQFDEPTRMALDENKWNGETKFSI